MRSWGYKDGKDAQRVRIALTEKNRQEHAGRGGWQQTDERMSMSCLGEEGAKAKETGNQLTFLFDKH